jgi:hypothetical protein
VPDPVPTVSSVGHQLPSPAVPPGLVHRSAAEPEPAAEPERAAEPSLKPVAGFPGPAAVFAVASSSAPPSAPRAAIRDKAPPSESLPASSAGAHVALEHTVGGRRTTRGYATAGGNSNPDVAIAREIRTALDTPAAPLFTAPHSRVSAAPSVPTRLLPVVQRSDDPVVDVLPRGTAAELNPRDSSPPPAVHLTTPGTFMRVPEAARSMTMRAAQPRTRTGALPVARAAPAAGPPPVQPPSAAGTSQGPASTSKYLPGGRQSQAAPGVDIGLLAEQIYGMIVRRLATENDRRGR